MHRNDKVALQYAKGDQAFFSVSLAYIFTRDREVIPDRVATGEIETVIRDVLPALRFVPSDH